MPSCRCRSVRLLASLCRGGMRAFDQGDAALAESMQRQALDLVRELGGLEMVEAKIHNNLGVILTCEGRRDEAAGEYAQALRLIDRNIGTGNRLYQVALMNFRKTLNRQLDQEMDTILAVAG